MRAHTSLLFLPLLLLAKLASAYPNANGEEDRATYQTANDADLAAIYYQRNKEIGDYHSRSLQAWRDQEAARLQSSAVNDDSSTEDFFFRIKKRGGESREVEDIRGYGNQGYQDEEDDFEREGFTLNPWYYSGDFERDDTGQVLIPRDLFQHDESDPEREVADKSGAHRPRPKHPDFRAAHPRLRAAYPQPTSAVASNIQKRSPYPKRLPEHYVYPKHLELMKEYPYLFGVKDEQEMRELHDSGKDYTKTFYGSAVANEAVQRGVPLKDVLRFIRDYDEIRGNKHYIGEYDMNRLSRNNMPQNKADERAMEMDFENSVQPVEGIRQEVDKDIGDDVPRRFLKGSRWKAKTPVERQELYRMLGADR